MFKSISVILGNPQYFGIAWVFTSLNILLGTWIIYIPFVKKKLMINKSELGFAIFFLTLGVLFIFPFASKIIHRFGAGRVTAVAGLVNSLIMPLPLLADSYYTLITALFFFGVLNGLTDIAMNTGVVELEKRNKVKFMSSAHGFFSAGGILAGLGSFLIVPISNTLLHVCLVSFLVIVVHLFFCRYYYDVKSTSVVEEKGAKPKGEWVFLFFLIVISFIAMGSEGAIVDWGGLYLKEITLADARWWGMGFLVFQVSMTLGRFCGDELSNKYHSLSILALAGVVVLFGYVLVLVGFTWSAILGFFICGLGFSVMVPEIFRICSNEEGADASKNIALLAGAGYLGFVVAPPLMGFVGETFSLRGSFTMLLGAIFLLIISVGFLKKFSK